MSVPEKIVLPSRSLASGLVEQLRSFRTGDRIELIQKVRVGAREWTTQVQGEFRGISYLATGITTERVPEDDIIVPTVHFIKENGERGSITLDENTMVKRLG